MTTDSWALIGEWLELGRRLLRQLLVELHMPWLAPGHLLLAIAASLFLLVFFILTRTPRGAAGPLFAAFRGRNLYETSEPALRTTLQSISYMWTEEGSERRRMELRRLSNVWKNPVIAADVQPDPQLHYDPLQQFYERYVRTAPYFHGALIQRQVVIQLLEILDQEGDIPSVLRIPKMGKISDPESNMPDARFALLVQTSLRDHALHVAVRVIQALDAEGARHIIPDAAIAALAHDFGKLERERGELQAVGNHVLVARRLQDLEGFEHLKHGGEILLAIKGHHGEPADRVGRLLALAESEARDQEAREARDRVATYAAKSGPKIAPARQPSTPAPTPKPNPPAAAKPQEAKPQEAKPAPVAAGHPAPERAAAGAPPQLPPEMWTRGSGYETDVPPSAVAAAELETAEAPRSPAAEGPPPQTAKPLQYPPKGMPLPDEHARAERSRKERPVPPTTLEANESGDDVAVARQFDEWFDLEEFLERVSPHINRPDGKKVLAMSRRTGEVYVQVQFIDGLLRVMADKAGYTEMAGFPKNSHPMRAILLRLRQRLQEKGFVNTDIMPAHAFGVACRFVFRKSSVSSAKVYLVLWASAWGNDVLEGFEKRKRSHLLNITAVLPDNQHGDEGPATGQEKTRA